MCIVIRIRYMMLIDDYISSVVLLQLEKHDSTQQGGHERGGGQDGGVKWRGEEEMKAEATQLKTFFTPVDC